MKSTEREIRIGILGGTFDPVHNAHLKLARAAHRFLKLDQLIFVPAHISPFKRNQKVTSARDRLAMLRIATKKFPWAKVSDVDLKRKGVSYTIQTLRYFQKKFGKRARLFIIMGMDAFKTFPKWKDSRKILYLAQIAVARRPQYKANRPHWPHLAIPMEEMPISATELRKWLSSKSSPKGKGAMSAIPAEVRRYIQKKQIFS